MILLGNLEKFSNIAVGTLIQKNCPIGNLQLPFIEYFKNSNTFLIFRALTKLLNSIFLVPYKSELFGLCEILLLFL